MNISVIGAGSWGTALSYVLSNNGHNVCLWSYSLKEVNNILKFRENKFYLPNVKISEKIIVTNNIEEAIRFANVIVLAVPSSTVRNNIKNMVTYLKKDQIIVNASKGIECDTLKTLSQVIEELAPMCKIGTISGPSHAEEVGKGLPTTCVVAFRDKKIAKFIQDLFMNERFRVYTNNDIIGVELGGALKNVIALSAGISDGLGYGDNTKAAIMTRGIKEISDLGIAMEGDINTFLGLSGIGDLIVTCTSMHSRNRKAGILLAKGKCLNEVLKEVGMVVEGVNTAKAAYKLSIRYNIDMPITKAVNDILFEGKDILEIMEELMTREKKSEF